MSVKPVVPRDRANRDVDDAITYCLKELAGEAALRLVDALEDAYGLLGRHPAIGSSRYAHELGIPGLRSWSLPDFPTWSATSSGRITSMSGESCMAAVTSRR
jgi:toxin ParE1/3/4